MKRIVSLMLVLSLSICSAVYADDDKNYLIEITPTKKVIHVERLGVSDNTSVLEILYMMPEVLSRGTDNPLDRFSIQVDGRDAGNCQEAVLAQTKIAEVDVLEITISPAVSDQKNGQGGVINIKLKPVSREGVSGIVMADVATNPSIQPALLLNYKKNRFTLRSSILMEHDNVNTTYDSREHYFVTNSDVTNMDTASNVINRETVKLHMFYKFNQQNELQFALWESYSKRNQTTNRGITEMENITRLMPRSSNPVYEKNLYLKRDTALTDKFLFEGNMEFKHLYRRGGQFTVQFSYNISPSNSDVDSRKSSTDNPRVYLRMDSLDEQYTMKRSRQLMSEIKTKHLLSNPADENVRLFLTAGVNTNYTTSLDSMDYRQIGPGRPYGSSTVTDLATLYVSPFSTVEYASGDWHFQGGVRYQYMDGWYRKATSADLTDYTNQTVTGDLSAQWQMRTHHNLRLMAARNIVRNLDKVLPLYNVELNYIYDLSRNGNNLVTNLCGHYIHADETDGNSDVFNLNAQLYYEHGVFALAFAGNLYRKTWHYNEGADYTGWYYNLNITPIFSLRNDWNISGKVTYNSRIKAYNMDLGECFYTQLRVAKRLNHWSLFAELDDIMDYVSYDRYTTPTSEVVEKYDMYQRAFWLGFEYRF
ncbi:MAG: TonB-dependent receptor [Bacteroidaceae bacterium]|nr:TonB-dependent receptor [Bacteroidaceae bacterium]